jgi:hypothetical protein
MPAYKLDIFDLLNRLNSSKSADIYAELSEEERKGFAPLVAMRWMTGTSDERQIMMLNEFVNPYIFSLGKHPHLLMQCLQASSSKVNRRYAWYAIKTSKKSALTVRVIQEYFGISSREAETYLIPPADELLQMAEELGWEKDVLKKLEKELNCK